MRLQLAIAILSASLPVSLQNPKASPTPPTGRDDTPFLPGGEWRVHDGERPRPVTVNPATYDSQEAPAKPPSDALVLEWQTYDIGFIAPRFKEGKLVSPACATVLHNGVLVQNHQELLGPTVHRALAAYAPHDSLLPLRLQDHNNLVRFRNIWIRPLGQD